MAIVLFSLSALAQKVPEVKIRDVEHKYFNTIEFSRNNGKPVIIIFWATWNSESKKFLSQVDAADDKWRENSGADVNIVSIDDYKTEPTVRPYLSTKRWSFDAYLDTELAFKKAMKVTTIPHVFVLDGNGHIVWETSKITSSTISEIASKLKD